MNIKETINQLKKERKELTGYPSADQTHLNDVSYLKKNPIIPSISIYNLLKIMRLADGKKPAVDSLEVKLNYNEINEKSVIVSKAFKELGVKPGDIISVAMDNYYQAIIVFLAANRIGAAVSFLNASLPIDEVKHYLNEFESPIFVDFDKDDEYNKKIKSGTKTKQIITLNKDDLNKKEFNTSSNIIIGNTDFVSYNDLEMISDYYKKPFNTFFSGSQNSVVLFTSGSTGNPKSVVLTNKNVLAAEIYAKNTTPSENISAPKVLVCVPFCYPYGFVTSTLSTLFWGKEAILAPNVNKNNVSYYYSKMPGIVFGSPAFLDLTINNIPENQDLSSVSHFLSGGDFLTPQHANRGNDFFKNHGSNVEISNAYGNAETVSMGSTQMGLEIKPETAGKFLYGIKTLFVDPETLEEKKYGEEGLLLVAGKHVFKEYFNNPELTSESKIMIDGTEYYNTGALGSLSEDGYFTITGREARFYIMASLNKVYCDFVKKAISSLDFVQDCEVVKVPDEENLYVNKAYIVLNDNVEKTDEIKQKLIQLLQYPIESIGGQTIQLKDYEIPTYIEFLDQLPRKDDSDKVDYLALEEDALKEISSNLKLSLKQSK